MIKPTGSKQVTFQWAAIITGALLGNLAADRGLHISFVAYACTMVVLVGVSWAFDKLTLTQPAKEWIVALGNWWAFLFLFFSGTDLFVHHDKPDVYGNIFFATIITALRALLDIMFGPIRRKLQNANETPTQP